MKEYELDSKSLLRAVEFRLHINIIGLMVIGAVIYYKIVELYTLTGVFKPLTSGLLKYDYIQLITTVVFYVLIIRMLVTIVSACVRYVMVNKRKSKDKIGISEEGIFIVTEIAKHKIISTEDIHEILVHETKRTIELLITRGKKKNTKIFENYYITKDSYGVEETIERVMPNKLKRF